MIEKYDSLAAANCVVLSIKNRSGVKIQSKFVKKVLEGPVKADIGLTLLTKRKTVRRQMHRPATRVGHKYFLYDHILLE